MASLIGYQRAAGTLSLVAGTLDAGYAVDDLHSGDPGDAVRFTGTSATVRETFGGAQAVQGVSLHNHAGLAGATVALSNNAGLSQAIAIPAASAAGKPVDPFFDLRGLANLSATQWNLAISGASNPFTLGEWALWGTVLALDVRAGVKRRLHRHSQVNQNRFGTIGGYDFSEHQRGYDLTVERAASGEVLYDLFDVVGVVSGWLLVVDAAVNDALFARFVATPLEQDLPDPAVVGATFAVEEFARGVL